MTTSDCFRLDRVPFSYHGSWMSIANPPAHFGLCARIGTVQGKVDARIQF
jgi:hypothetical protein